MNALLIDFGSTYTKLTAVDVENAKILQTAQRPTTVETDITLGFEAALAEMGEIRFDQTLACSSAAGGLRMAACGLVPSLTMEAARMAALGAGAKVIKAYAYRMTGEDIAEVEAIAPDIFLLTGGTDGGNRENIVENARSLAGAKGNFPVILAGNRAAVSECARLLEKSGHAPVITENVMPTFNRLNIEPAKQAVRELFLERIVRAKGLSRAQALLNGILMPTPSAVLGALELLAESVGEVMAVDLGGATTDVYSIAEGLPESAGTMLAGLPEPYAKRTVEGDIGMRWSAQGIVEAAGMPRVLALSGLSEGEAKGLLEAIQMDKSILPGQEDAMARLDFALATLAIEIGLVRHCGTIERVFTPLGAAWRQHGKDLRRVNRLILTGGALARAREPGEMARAAMQSEAGDSLKPTAARVLVDGSYILSAMGLLATAHRDAARKLLLEYFQ